MAVLEQGSGHPRTLQSPKPHNTAHQTNTITPITTSTTHQWRFLRMIVRGKTCHFTDTGQGSLPFFLHNSTPPRAKNARSNRFIYSFCRLAKYG